MHAMTTGVVLGCLIACGGRSTLYGETTDAGAEGPPAAYQDAASERSLLDSGPCDTPEGVRICGGSQHCPWLTPPECPGQGCTQTGSDPSTGVCWSDLPDKGQRLCAACNDGEVCVFRGTGELICAPTDLCETLWGDGDTLGCRYADKSRYTNVALPTPSGPCPGGLAGQFILCGGECGDCPSRLPCVGRSPGRPFGICATFAPGGTQQVVSTCSVPPGAYDCRDQAAACAVFTLSPSDEPLAKQYGLCMPASDCNKAAEVMPGGLRCY